MTYKSFTDAATFFALLTARYRLNPPPGLSDEQIAEWKEKKERPTQSRVLSTLQDWVERYRLVKDEPHMVSKVIDFLNGVQAPPKNQLTAKQLLQTIEKKVRLLIQWV